MPHSLRVVHILRAPIGGLFRHVCDLVAGQAARGLDVGVICDSSLNSPSVEQQLGALSKQCSLGLHRIPMTRLPSLADMVAVKAVKRLARTARANILHGHGAKGGAYARLAAHAVNASAVYTPHGGSLHYSRASISGALFLTMEQMLLSRTDQFVFVCDFERDAFFRKIGKPKGQVTVAHNGIRPEEITPAIADPAAADLLYIGELRTLKGVDLLLKSMAALTERPALTACIVGGGPDEAEFKALAAKLGLAGRVTFTGPLPARQAFSRGRLLVVPSRAESLPYIVLEAMAASLPLVVSRVGGVPEVLEGYEDLMVCPVAVDPLAAAIDDALADLRQRQRTARHLTQRIATQFSCARMIDQVTRAYLKLVQQPSSATATVYGHPSPAE
ncbi:glycosyltransferase family 4 protein [Rhodoligotrophos appendicifer]|uniref:glycosyltransferase family 4 protein n=1 Tax=Rhodoligotrophos appendicifer TaxID=987056 RepID=UPI001184C00B|nr:glycosyltransferase family 4 protein [Rhodoligotrophos appendicifer]